MSWIWVILGILILNAFLKKFRKSVDGFGQLTTMEQHPYIRDIKKEIEDQLQALNDEPVKIKVKRKRVKKKDSSPIFIEGKGYVVNNGETDQSQPLVLEVLESEDHPTGGIDLIQLRGSLQTDLRKAVILKEILDRKY